MLIFDTGADQCAIGGQAWEILEVTDEEVICNGYLKGDYAQEGPTLPIVSGMTCCTPTDGEDFLIVMHQSTYNADEQQTESLCLPFQC